MNKSILLATIAVLLVAGCTQNMQLFQQVTVNQVTGAGLVISDFSVDPTSVFSNSNARLMMTVDNKGDYPVLDTNSLIWLTGSNINLADTTGTSWSNSDESLFKHFGKTMNPPDDVSGTPGGEKIITWSLKAPNVTRGQVRPDNFIARVYYDYQTSVMGTIWVYSQSESDAARNAKSALLKANFSSTSGPLAVTVRASPDPIVLAPNENTFTMIIKLSNVGGGVLYRAGAVTYTAGSENIALTDDDFNKVDVEVNSPQITFSGCTGEQDLVSSSDLTLSCDATMQNLPSNFAFQGFPVTVTASYGYYTERSVDVSTSGR